jgi:uncharacterized membrane protein
VNESKRKLNFFDLAQKLSETVFSYEGYIRYLKETLKKKERLVEKYLQDMELIIMTI